MATYQVLALGHEECFLDYSLGPSRTFFRVVKPSQMVRKEKQRLILLCANRRAECGANTCRFFSLRQLVYAAHNIPKDFLIFLALNIGVEYSFDCDGT